MSVASSTRSTQSVSFFGDDVEFEQAIDQTFLDAQQFLNQIHVEIRALSGIDDEKDRYIEALELYQAIYDNIDGLAVCFAELKGVSKQVLGRPPKELKEEVKESNTRWKERRAREKEEKKREIAENKAAAKAAAAEEKKN